MHIAFLLLGPLSPAFTPAAPSLLSAVPGHAYALSYCDEVAALRERMRRNDWVRLLGSEAGEPVLLDFDSALRTESGVAMDSLVDLGLELHGESVAFATADALGFLTAPTESRDRLAGAMRAMLPAADGVIVRRTVELAGGRIDVAVFPADAAPDSTGVESIAQGRVHAFLDHPNVLGLFAAEDEAALGSVVRGAVANLGTEHRAPLVRAFETARREVGPTGGIEVFVDFSPFAERAQAALASASGGLFFDPSQLLGLERGTTLYSTMDMWPGHRVECRGRLAIPAQTLAAELADTLRPLPADLLGKFPAGVWCAHALNWDIAGVYDIARAGLEKREAEELEVIDQGLAAAEQTTGVDVENAVLRQLAGLFALYFTEPRPGMAPLEDFRTFGLLLGLHDGDAFLDAMETLLGIAIFEDFQQIELEGADAFVARDAEARGGGLDDEFDGGAALLPHAVIFAPARQMLVASLRAHAGKQGASLLEDGSFRAAFDENLGACYMTCVDLGVLQRYALPELGDDPALPPFSGDGEPTNPFRAQLVATGRRTATGVDFRVYTR